MLYRIWMEHPDSQATLIRKLEITEGVPLNCRRRKSSINLKEITNNKLILGIWLGKKMGSYIFKRIKPSLDKVSITRRPD